jgi:hypothetical protein
MPTHAYVILRLIPVLSLRKSSPDSVNPMINPKAEEAKTPLYCSCSFPPSKISEPKILQCFGGSVFQSFQFQVSSFKFQNASIFISFVVSRWISSHDASHGESGKTFYRSHYAKNDLCQRFFGLWQRFPTATNGSAAIGDSAFSSGSTTAGKG